MEKRKEMSYKWVKRLVDKITKSDAPLNNSFMYYGHAVEQSSGTADYTSVTIFDNNRAVLGEFAFDFLTRDLDLLSYVDDDFRMALVKAFVGFYDSVKITDDTIEERRTAYQWYLDNPEEYDDDVLEEVRKEIEIIDNLPVGKVKMSDLNGK